jgi:hypothetical protein
MAIFFSDSAISAVNVKFGMLISADFPPLVYCVMLVVKMAGRTVSATLFDIPATIRVWNNVMRFTAHKQHSFS